MEPWAVVWVMRRRGQRQHAGAGAGVDGDGAGIADLIGEQRQRGAGVDGDGAGIGEDVAGNGGVLVLDLCLSRR